MTLLKRYNRNFFLYLSPAFLFFFAFSTAASAQGNLQVMPKRVVFEGNKRFQELNLANTGQDSAQFVISFINYKMKENGEFQEITTPEEGQNFADKFLRIFPRTVTLAPNEAQSIKVQVIKTSNLAAGEYRSHIYFRAVPPVKPLGEKDTKADTSSGISIKLTPVFGLSIPTIIRMGEPDVKITLSDLTFDNSNNLPKLKLIFNRSGNMSVYGDLTINYISPEGTVKQVGMAKGLAVYTPNPKRSFILNLEQNKDINYRKGKLQVIYTTPQDAKSISLAEATLALN